MKNLKPGKMKKQKKGENNSNANVAVKEDYRIQFQQQLARLREDMDVDEVVFPATLTNVERKYLHKLAEELGLISKSSGVGENRQITIRKRVDKLSREELIRVELKPESEEILTKFFSDNSLALEKPATSASFVESRQTPSLDEDLEFLTNSYWKAAERLAQRHDKLATMQRRNTLPASHYRDAVCSLVKQHSMVLISGETGCGKTTQVPQFLLEDPEMGPTCRMVVTQPRRLSAISVSGRVAQERGEKLGETIGYNIRMESEKSRATQCLFVTPGVLIRKIQSDPDLLEFSHVIIDEAHERDRFTEFLFIVLRRICARRPSLRLILMSATMQTSKLSDYFGGIPNLHIGCSMFPVQEFFLEHALRFTNFLSSSAYSNRSHKNLTNASGATALPALLRPAYNCSLCNEKEPFFSPEEFGTHAALCCGKPHQQPKRGDDYHQRKTNLELIVQGLRAAANRNLVDTKDVTAKEIVGGKVKTEVLRSNDLGLDAGDGVDDDVSEDGLAGLEGSFTPSLKESTVVEKQHSSGTFAEDFEGSEELLAAYQTQFDDIGVDYDLIESLLRYIFRSEFCKEGNVLVFLPGWDDISRMYRLLLSHPEFSQHKYKILQLHSGIPKSEQAAVFHPSSQGEHKIILSTNIAETSITIDDIAVVIDSGRAKEKTYDPHVKLCFLKSNWISQAAARQRVGRAGRTRAGVCFHLFSHRRHRGLPSFQESELLRMPLEELALQAKSLGLAPGFEDSDDSITGFLLQALDPPHLLSVKNAIASLQVLGCLDNVEELTELGKAISTLPIEPKLGRTLLLGHLCGCDSSIVSLTAAIGYRDPFVLPVSEAQKEQCNRAKYRLAHGNPSDQYALLGAMEGFNLASQRFGFNKAQQFCDEHFLSRSTMFALRDIVRQFHGLLRDLQLVSTARSQRNDGNSQLLLSLIGLGLYPSFGVRRKGASVFTTEGGRKARIHPSSVNCKSASYRKECLQQIEIICYENLVAGAISGGLGPNLLMLNTSPMSVFGLMLICGSLRKLAPANRRDEATTEGVVDVVEDNNGGDDIVVVEIDGWLRFAMKEKMVSMIECARSALSVALQHLITGSNGKLPSADLSAVDAISRVLALEQPFGPVLESANSEVVDNGDHKNHPRVLQRKRT